MNSDPAARAEAKRILDAEAKRLLAARRDRDTVDTSPGEDLDAVDDGDDERPLSVEGETVPIADALMVRRGATPARSSSTRSRATSRASRRDVRRSRAAGTSSSPEKASTAAVSSCSIAARSRSASPFLAEARGARLAFEEALHARHDRRLDHLGANRDSPCAVPNWRTAVGLASPAASACRRSSGSRTSRTVGR